MKKKKKTGAIVLLIRTTFCKLVPLLTYKVLGAYMDCYEIGYVANFINFGHETWVLIQSLYCVSQIS